MKLTDLTPGEAERFFVEGKITVAVVGLGRIGLPSAIVFASAGARVIGADISEEVVAKVNAGKSKFTDEPGLNEMLRVLVLAGRLAATTDVTKAVAESDMTIICVPTPIDNTKSPDYSCVEEASRTVGRALRRGSVVVVESTVGPGTVENMVRDIIESESGLKAPEDFGLASCPERSDPGNILKNMRTVPRVIGAINGQCRDITAAIYEAAFGVKTVKVSDPKTANAVKLTENLFRDVNIALANEFALLFEKLGIDSVEVTNACASKYNFMPHYAGAGVGGPCLPSNSYYLISEGQKAGNIPYLIRMAREINDRMPEHVVELVSEALNDVGKTVSNSKIAILGITYKPGIKDLQLTPAERICAQLAEMGASIVVYDPLFAGEEALGHAVCKDLEEAVTDADCVVICTAHREFSELDLNALSELMRSPAALVDARNIVAPKDAREAGFAYRGVGRPPSRQRTAKRSSIRQEISVKETIN